MAAPEELKAGYASLQESGNFADGLLVCGPYQFKIRKAILAAHSQYFAKAFEADRFKEGMTDRLELKAAESDTDDLEYSCDDPELVRLMVNYFYRFDYSFSFPENPEEKPTPDERALKHAKVFAMAVKYQVKTLRALAVENFKLCMQLCMDYKDNKIDAVARLVYNSTPEEADELRQIMVDLIDRDYQIFDGEDMKELDSAILNTPDLYRKTWPSKPPRKTKWQQLVLVKIDNIVV